MVLILLVVLSLVLIILKDRKDYFKYKKKYGVIKSCNNCNTL